MVVVDGCLSDLNVLAHLLLLHLGVPPFPDHLVAHHLVFHQRSRQCSVLGTPANFYSLNTDHQAPHTPLTMQREALQQRSRQHQIDALQISDLP